MLPAQENQEQLFPLAAGVAVSECIGAHAARGKKPHQGFFGENRGLHQGFEACNSTIALGLRAGWAENRGGQFYRARYYDPQIGRFISEDPLGFLGSGTNFYAYVRNNPVNLTDPFGLCPKDKHKNCFWQALSSNGNGVALVLDVAEFIPVTSVVTAGLQTLLGSAGTVNSAMNGNTTGALMGIGGIHITAVTPMALDAGGALAKDIPIIGTGYNAVQTGLDLASTAVDYWMCLHGQ